MKSVLLAIAAVIFLPDAPAAQTADRCFRDTIVIGYHVKAYIGDRECIDLNHPQRFSGIWMNKFEGSMFFNDTHNLDDISKKSADTI
jgi:hypothetical protein